MSEPIASDAEEFDFVIVGAGSAGCVLAARLSENPSTSVLLLEAGPRDRHPAIRIPAAFPKLFDGPLDWGYRTTPQPELGNRRIFWPRGKVIGGSSSMNAMMWIRGAPSDYDRWADIAGPNWSWSVLLPYFLKLEDDDANGGDGRSPRDRWSSAGLGAARPERAHRGQARRSPRAWFGRLDELAG